MRALAHRPTGTTLPELLLAVVLLGILGTFVVGAVRAVARAGTRVQQVASQRRGSLTFATLLRRDLGEAVQGDIVLGAAREIRYRRPLAAALACRRTDSTVTLRDRDWAAERQAVAGSDSAQILVATDSSWETTALLATWPSTCVGEPATTYHFDRRPGQPIVHFHEMVRVAVYPSGGRNWLGMLTSGAGSIQPFAGPVATVAIPWVVDSTMFAAAASFSGPLRPFALRILLAPR
ncbi:MAG: hypothetical protein H0W15_04325 [Gemmatimonadales bacterium]|nr:hypothetical protein [Gemmatimonadales bacterium]